MFCIPGVGMGFFVVVGFLVVVVFLVVVAAGVVVVSSGHVTSGVSPSNIPNDNIRFPQ